MKTERIVLSIVAVLVGLLAAGGAFYLYQMTKTVPNEKTKPVTLGEQVTPTPTPDTGNYLTIDTPQDEEVSTKATITIAGKTNKEATIIVSSEDADQVVKPSGDGNFSLTMNIGSGTNLLQITAVYPNGEEKSVNKTVTYSTENF
jgi:hypothetical protein